MASLFSTPVRAGKSKDSAVAKKANSKIKTSPITTKSGGGVLEKINSIKAMVEKYLGNLRSEYILIRTEEDLEDYISKCIESNVISIDTETTGLDPMLDEIVGLCIYTPNAKAAYVPINHKSYVTQQKVDNQLSVYTVKEQLQRVVDSSIDVVMFNADFDIRVLRNQVGVYLKCTWDCYLAARLLNENEPSNRLKKLHQKYILNGEGEAFSFDDLFKGISFDYVPVTTGYLYAAGDAIKTYELYEFQKPFLTAADDVCISHGLKDVAWVFHNIEMPCVDVVADMEDTGVLFDFEYNQKLKDKYHPILDEREAEFHRLCDTTYKAQIDEYRRKTGISCCLSEPINIKSTKQLSTLLYDIMGCELYYDKKAKKSTKSTSDDALTALNNPISKAVQDYREFSTIVSTFIDKLPECVSQKDGRVHCKFNQYGADTGRMSSDSPNLQNIPSHNTDIRKMFTASDGYLLMSSDYSSQEPKCLAALCKADGDSQMYDTFMAGKDLYSEIASKAFHKPYDECREFRPDGTINKEGKARRTQAKSILLGINYGRGIDSIAEQLGTTKAEAQAIKDSVFKGFPAIKQFEESSINMAKTDGFVTTVCGRKRRLPSMMLPDYEFKWVDGVAPDDDPLGFDDEPVVSEVPIELQNKYLRKIQRSRFGQKRQIFEQANADGIWIIDHTRDKDTTKVVNARIQGSAADLTKVAMIKLHESEELKSLGFRLLIPVHDEVICECPAENIKACSELLAKTMSDAAAEILNMPISCDVAVSKEWYGEEIKV